MATFSVYMIRHGQTYFNKYRRMQGWCDSPLTAVGEQDARSELKYSSVFRCRLRQ